MIALLSRTSPGNLRILEKNNIDFALLVLCIFIVAPRVRQSKLWFATSCILGGPRHGDLDCANSRRSGLWDLFALPRSRDPDCLILTSHHVVPEEEKSTQAGGSPDRLNLAFEPRCGKPDCRILLRKGIPAQTPLNTLLAQ